MAAPLNLEVGLSASDSTAIRTGPFSATQGDFIVGGSGKLDAVTGGAVNWGLIAAIGGVALVIVAGLFLFSKRR